MCTKSYTHPRNNGTPSKRKFKGFNFYIQGNEKLSKKNRNQLLTKSEIYLNEITSSLPQPIEEQIRMGVIDELDSTLSDYELLEQWNRMYDEYGYLISKFKEQWEKEKMGTNPREKTPTLVQTLLDEIETLKNRVSKIEKLKSQLIPTSSFNF